jgi:hypothetical protein
VATAKHERTYAADAKAFSFTYPAEPSPLEDILAVASLVVHVAAFGANLLSAVPVAEATLLDQLSAI